MSDNLMIVLLVVFCTPFGWIGLLCLAAVLGTIFGGC